MILIVIGGFLSLVAAFVVCFLPVEDGTRNEVWRYWSFAVFAAGLILINIGAFTK